MRDKMHVMCVVLVTVVEIPEVFTSSECLWSEHRKAAQPISLREVHVHCLSSELPPFDLYKTLAERSAVIPALNGQLNAACCRLATRDFIQHWREGGREGSKWVRFTGVDGWSGRL